MSDISLSQIKKAASVTTAAFLLWGCQSRAESNFFDTPQNDPAPLWGQHALWFLGHPEIFLPLCLIAIALSVVLLRRLSKRFDNWVSKGVAQHLSFKPTIPFMWVYGFIAIFVLMLLLGFAQVRQSLDAAFYDTYYVVAHFHSLLIFGVIFGVFGIAYAVFKKVLRVGYSRFLAILQFAFVFMGTSLILFPPFLISARGMPRRYIDAPERNDWMNTIAALGAILILMGCAAFILVVIEALVKKRPIGDRDAAKKSDEK